MRAALLTVLLVSAPAFATSYAPPKRHDVYSRNRAFVLDVNPETRSHIVYDVRDRTTALWSFSCGVWHFPFLVSDDGAVVATVGWMHVKAEHIAEADAVTFWNKDGEFRSHPLRDVCPDPPKTRDVGVGPIGEFWRTWYTDVKDHGDSFTILTTRGGAFRFRYADGALVERRLGWRAWTPWLVAGVGGVVVLAVVWRWRTRRTLPSRVTPRPTGERAT